MSYIATCAKAESIGALVAFTLRHSVESGEKPHHWRAGIGVRTAWYCSCLTISSSFVRKLSIQQKVLALLKRLVGISQYSDSFRMGGVNAHVAIENTYNEAWLFDKKGRRLAVIQITDVYNERPFAHLVEGVLNGVPE